MSRPARLDIAVIGAGFAGLASAALLARQGHRVSLLANEPNLQQALAHYTRLRRPHLHFYSRASRLLTPAFQSNQRLLPWLRDGLMALVGRLPVAGQFSRETLVGVRQSWLPLWHGGRLDLAQFAASDGDSATGQASGNATG